MHLRDALHGADIATSIVLASASAKGTSRAAQEIHFIKILQARKWANRDDIGFFAVTINWMRYTDVNEKPWHVVEMVHNTSGGLM